MAQDLAGQPLTAHMGDRQPKPVPGEDREANVDVQQIADHWGLSRQYLRRIGHFSGPACAGCAVQRVPGGTLRGVSGGGQYAGTRAAVAPEPDPTPPRLLGNIFVAYTKSWALAHGFRRHLESLADGRPAPAREE